MVVKSRWDLIISRELLEATFQFFRLAVFCYLAAIGLFYFLVNQDTAFAVDKQAHRQVFAAFQWIYVGTGMMSLAYLFLAEKLVKNTTRRKIWLLIVVAIMFLTQGIAFREILPLIADQKISLVSYCLMVGVTGAAGFVFTADKHIFPTIALAWNLPIMQTMIFHTQTLPDVILSLMLGVYLIAMIYVQTMEYKRRVELIRTRLQILKEKTATMAAKNLAQRTLDKQHGDYFLLQRLFEPLVKINIPKAALSIETHLQQHKTFAFKGQSYSIGGDYIYVDEILLAGEKYYFATNADAMGKSLQGASGAIVFGVLINALVQRTKLRTSEAAKSPERWLKEAYAELDMIFSTFDGAMIVSAILLLIHESGTVFHINAEHPPLILYRNGEVIPFSLENQVYKLGTKVATEDFAVQTFRLQKNDRLILASDGRDDLLIRDAESQKIIMNHQLDIFGESLTEADANLNKCIEIMGQKGRFSDDLSVIMIGLPQGHEPPITEDLADLVAMALQNSHEAVAELVSKYTGQIAEHVEEMTSIMNFFIRHKAYDVGYEIAQALLKASPYSNKLLYFTSYLARKSGNFGEAAEYSERLRHRAPNHLANLLNSCYIYLRVGNKKRARFMHERAAAIDPENRHTKILAEALGLSAELAEPAVA